VSRIPIDRHRGVTFLADLSAARHSPAMCDSFSLLTIWYVGDYIERGAERYSTRIGAFRLPGCSE
jgi:hypothetical protein